MAGLSWPQRGHRLLQNLLPDLWVVRKLSQHLLAHVNRLDIPFRLVVVERETESDWCRSLVLQLPRLLIVISRVAIHHLFLFDDAHRLPCFTARLVVLEAAPAEVLGQIVFPLLNVNVREQQVSSLELIG